jgi:D-arabinose 1-dehydrogenase-like Zn-dependent alcohol dehydrogenase
MKAAVVHGKGDIRIEEYSTPSASEGEIVVRTKMCGICATDIKTLLGQGLPKDLPTILGHEVVGEIAEIGSRSIPSLSAGNAISAREVETAFVNMNSALLTGSREALQSSSGCPRRSSTSAAL